MKYLLVIAVVLVGFWAWRNQRMDEESKRPARKQSRSPARMVACRLCGTHVPEGEQLSGRQGDYCCAAHRQQAEGPGA